MNAAQRENAEILSEGLSRVSLGRPGGSQTGVRSVITDKIKGGLGGWGSSIRTFLKGPVQGLIATGEDAAFDRSVKSLGEAVFNPTWQPRLSKLKNIDSSTPKFTQSFAQLMRDVQSEEATPDTLSQDESR